MVDSSAGDGQRAVEAKAVRISKVESMQALGHDDRVAPVGGEVHVVRVVDGDRPARLRSTRVDRRDAVALVVEDIEPLQVPRRGHMLRKSPDGEVADDSEGARVDHVDGVAPAVGDVHPRKGGARGRAKHVRPVRCVEISGRRCRDPLTPLPPATRMRVPSLVAAASESGVGSLPAGRTRRARVSTATTRAVGESMLAPLPPIT